MGMWVQQGCPLSHPTRGTTSNVMICTLLCRPCESATSSCQARVGRFEGSFRAMSAIRGRMKSNPSFNWIHLSQGYIKYCNTTYLNELLLDGTTDVEDVGRKRVARSTGILKFQDFLVTSPDRDFHEFDNRFIIATRQAKVD